MAHALPPEIADAVRSRLARDWSSPVHRVQRAALFTSCGFYGLRKIEVIHLQRRHLDARTGTLYVATAKGGNPRRIPLDVRFAAALVSHHDKHTRLQTVARGKPIDESPLIAGPGTTRISRSTAERYARPYLTTWGNYSFHSMRHTAATEMWDATGDILVVMRYLGHRTLRQTHTYLGTIIADYRPGLPRWKPQLRGPSRQRVFTPTPKTTQ